MSTYVAEYEYSIKEFGSVTLDAANPDQAEDDAYDYVRDTYDDVFDVAVTSVTEIDELHG